MERLVVIHIIFLSLFSLNLEARSQKTEEAALARDLYLMISTYRSVNEGKLPVSYEELRALDPNFRDRLDSSVESRYKFIDQHVKPPHKFTEGLKLILISSSAIPLGESKERIGRYLVYVDESGELKQLGQTEDWFDEFIGNAIPGIAFGEVPEIEEPAVETSAIASEVDEVIEGVTAPEPIIEEPAEVIVAKPIEENVKQSSQWWLWLLGLLVVFGGILVVRRKS